MTLASAALSECCQARVIGVRINGGVWFECAGCGRVL